MTRCCPLCAIELSPEQTLCAHHLTVVDWVDWAEGNRLICDGLHRGRWAARRLLDLRENDIIVVT